MRKVEENKKRIPFSRILKYVSERKFYNFNEYDYLYDIDGSILELNALEARLNLLLKNGCKCYNVIYLLDLINLIDKNLDIEQIIKFYYLLFIDYDNFDMHLKAYSQYINTCNQPLIIFLYIIDCYKKEYIQKLKLNIDKPTIIKLLDSLKNHIIDYNVKKVLYIENILKFEFDYNERIKYKLPYECKDLTNMENLITIFTNNNLKNLINIKDINYDIIKPLLNNEELCKNKKFTRNLESIINKNKIKVNLDDIKLLNSKNISPSNLILISENDKYALIDDFIVKRQYKKIIKIMKDKITIMDNVIFNKIIDSKLRWYEIEKILKASKKQIILTDDMILKLFKKHDIWINIGEVYSIYKPDKNYPTNNTLFDSIKKLVNDNLNLLASHDHKINDKVVIELYNIIDKSREGKISEEIFLYIAKEFSKTYIYL